MSAQRSEPHDSESYDIEPYDPRHAAAAVSCWNRSFAGQLHFQPLTETGWRQRIERPELEPDLLLLAIRDAEVIGFVHGGLWSEAWCAALFPDQPPAEVGYLACVAVAPDERRQRVGTELVAGLRRRLSLRAGHDLAVRADGRMFNPFYGNSRAPVPPPWGTTEGISVAAADTGTRAFLRGVGLEEQQRAVSLRMDTRLPRTSPGPAVGRVEWLDDCDPHLGAATAGEPFLEANRSRTWVLWLDGVVAGAVVAFPLGEDLGDRPLWGIHSLAVHPDHGGRGIGTALLKRLLDDLRPSDAVVEVLALPDESPAGWHLYRNFDGQPVAEWVVFG